MQSFYPDGFQVIVLAGGQGSRMTELTAGKPKCLLPIGNKPMIWYPLNTLEKYGFSEAIVIVSESSETLVSTALEKFNLKIKLDIVAVPGIENIGTAESIKFIYDKIKSDVIFISADLIADINLSKTIQLFYKYNASVTALFFQMPEIPETFKTPGPKNNQKIARDLIIVEEKSERLVYFSSAVDFNKPIKSNTFNKLIRKFPNVKSYSKLLDSHTYIMKKWVVDFLVSSKNLTTLRGDFLPYIVKKQLSKQKTIVEDKNASVVNVNVNRDILDFAEQDQYESHIRKMSSYNDPYNGDIIRCNAHIDFTCQALRVNTLKMYSYANAMMNSWYNFDKSNPGNTIISPSADVKCTQLLNANIDDNSIIKEKTSIKHSNIGCNTTVESKTGITKSILMNNVTVKERCIIENSIICNDCVIEEGAKLINCIVGSNITVSSGSTYTQEELASQDSSNWFIED